jgi:hypothetical protein
MTFLATVSEEDCAVARNGRPNLWDTTSDNSHFSLPGRRSRERALCGTGHSHNEHYLQKLLPIAWKN